MFEFLFGSKPQLEDLEKIECDASADYKSFQSHYILEIQAIGDEIIQWYDSKTEGKTLVLFPGTTGMADVWFSYFVELSKSFRVLVPNLPEVESLEHLNELFFNWLDQLEIETTTILGQSFGGVIAQTFADKYPNRVEQIVLLTSFANTASVKDKTRKNYLRSISRFTKAVNDLKFESLQKSIYKQVVKGVDVAFVEDKPFWKAFYGNMFLNSSKELLTSMHQIQLDYWKNVRVEPALYTGRVLLIETTTDASYDREEKKALMNRYPGADLFEIEGSSNMSHVRESVKIIKKIVQTLS